jgi:hypothetical protein
VKENAGLDAAGLGDLRELWNSGFRDCADLNSLLSGSRALAARVRWREGEVSCGVGGGMCRWLVWAVRRSVNGTRSGCSVW